MLGNGHFAEGCVYIGQMRKPGIISLSYVFHLPGTALIKKKEQNRGAAYFFSTFLFLNANGNRM